MNEKSMKVRKIIKSKKPKHFLRTDSNVVNFKSKWRRPRGIHNKRRLNKRGHQKNPSQGYRSPIDVRGLNRHGKREIIINNVRDLSKVNAKTDIAVLAKSLGLKKKLAILKELKNTNIEVQGIKHPEKFISTKEEEIKQRKEQRKKTIQTRDAKKKELEKKKAEEKAKKEESAEKQEKVKEEVLHAPQKEEHIHQQEHTHQKTDTKAQHKQSSLPGDRK